MKKELGRYVFIDESFVKDMPSLIQFHKFMDGFGWGLSLTNIDHGHPILHEISKPLNMLSEMITKIEHPERSKFTSENDLKKKKKELIKKISEVACSECTAKDIENSIKIIIEDYYIINKNLIYNEECKKQEDLPF